MSTIPEWRKHAKMVYYTPYGETEEKHVLLCPDHRIEFYTLQPSAHERGDNYPVVCCQVCRREAWFEAIAIIKDKAATEMDARENEAQQAEEMQKKVAENDRKRAIGE